MKCPRAALFDLDDTLAESFEAPKADMIERLKKVLDLMPLAIITGRDFSRTESGFLPELTTSPHADRLFVMPEGSALCFGWENGAWVERYGSSISDEDRDIITKAIEQSIEETGVLEGLPVFGQRFIEKRAQVAFAALGLDVPHDLKYSWDPGNERRKVLRESVAAKLPEYEVTMGGATSIDIMKKGINKSLGVRWLSKHLDIPTSEMLYVGDAFYESGNDAPVIPTGVQTRDTSGPAETLTIIDDLLTSCSSI